MSEKLYFHVEIVILILSFLLVLFDLFILYVKHFVTCCFKKRYINKVLLTYLLEGVRKRATLTCKRKSKLHKILWANGKVQMDFF